MLLYSGTHFDAAAYFKATALLFKYTFLYNVSSCLAEIPVLFMFSLSLSLLKINNHTTKLSTESWHCCTSSLAFSQWFQLTFSQLNQPRTCSDGQQQSCLDLWAQEEKSSKQEWSQFTLLAASATAITNSMHLVLKENTKRRFVFVIQAPWTLKFHS